VNDSIDTAVTVIDIGEESDDLAVILEVGGEVLGIDRSLG